MSRDGRPDILGIRRDGTHLRLVMLALMQHPTTVRTDRSASSHAALDIDRLTDPCAWALRRTRGVAEVSTLEGHTSLAQGEVCGSRRTPTYCCTGPLKQ